ncbi:hypothetical protein JCM10213_002564 [Rhodosporidiobolus nylandii]
MASSAPHLPSPSKKAAYAPLPQPSPDSHRGSFQRQLTSEWADQIRAGSMRGRAAVNRGALTTSASTSRRPLGPSKTEGTLLFTQKSLPSRTTGTFQTANDTLEQVYAPQIAGPRPNELQPMGSTNNLFPHLNLAAQDSGVFPSTSTAEAADGDGFDMDDVFGEAPSNLNLDFLGAGNTQNAMGVKRAFDDTAAEDDELATTDVEDDEMGDLPAARPTTGRSFGRTKSLPASAFGKMDF